MVIEPTRHVSILGHPESAAMSEGQHSVLNAAKGLLATKAYGKRKDVEPYIPRRIHARIVEALEGLFPRRQPGRCGTQNRHVQDAKALVW